LAGKARRESVFFSFFFTLQEQPVPSAKALPGNPDEPQEASGSSLVQLVVEPGWPQFWLIGVGGGVGAPPVQALPLYFQPQRQEQSEPSLKLAAGVSEWPQ
jgi:hypothetical protein